MGIMLAQAAMSSDVLKRNDLDLKDCLETFRNSPFSLETFLNCREEFLKNNLKCYEGNYLGIITKIIRELFLDIVRQAFTIFDDNNSETLILKFINKVMFELILILRKNLIYVKVGRPELTQFWHSTILTGDALKPFWADFSVALDDIFALKMFDIIKAGLDDRLKDFANSDLTSPEASDSKIIKSETKRAEPEGFIENGAKYDLITTIALNSVVDVINQVRLCPGNELLKEKVKIELENRPELSESIKKWAKKQL